MLRSRRRLVVPSLNAAHRIDSVLHSRYRVNVVSLRGLVAEDRLFLDRFPRRGHLGRPMATVVLRGRARLNWGDRAVHLSAGSLAILPSKSGAFMRQDPSYLAINVEWDPELFGAAPTELEAMQLQSVHHVRAITAGLIASESSRQTSLAVRCFFAWLRAEGLGLESPDAPDFMESVAPRTRALSGALDHLLSNLEGGPQMVDLDDVLGVSKRQANRLVQDFNRRYGFNAVSWQESRTRRKLMNGAVLATAAGMSTEKLAEVTGYCSPTALCRAFARAGLPSPATISDRVAVLA